MIGIAAPGYPDAARGRWPMATLALLAFFLSTDITLTTILIEPLKRDMAMSDNQVGLLQGTALGLSLGFSSIPMGWLVDRAVRVRLLFAGLVVWIAAMTGTGLAANVTTLVVARVALGAVGALLIPAAFSLIADLYPPERRSVATSLFVAGQASGQAFGILAGGLAFDLLTRLIASHRTDLHGLTPWRALYLAGGAGGLLLLVLVAAMREPARQERRDASSSALAGFGVLWIHRRFLGPVLAALLFNQITIQAAAVWATPVLIRDYHRTPGQFAWWLGAITLLGGILGAVVGGRLGELGRRRGGRTGVLMPAMIGAGAMAPLSLFAVAPGVPAFAVLLALGIFAGAAVATLGIVAITLNVPNEVRGLAIGVNFFTSSVFGTATAPAAIAMLSGALGGEGRLGAAIAGVCIPSALLAALFFALAMRAGRKGLNAVA